MFKKHAVVLRSSTESEYRALATAATEVLWIIFLLHELGLTLSSVPTLWFDNQSDVVLACNPKFRSRPKHIKLDVLFLKEKVAAKSLQVCYISKSEQLIDILTKPLSYNPFQYLRSKLNLTSPV